MGFIAGNLARDIFLRALCGVKRQQFHFRTCGFLENQFDSNKTHLMPKKIKTKKEQCWFVSLLTSHSPHMLLIPSELLHLDQ